MSRSYGAWTVKIRLDHKHFMPNGIEARTVLCPLLAAQFT